MPHFIIKIIVFITKNIHIYCIYTYKAMIVVYKFLTTWSFLRNSSILNNILSFKTILFQNVGLKYIFFKNLTAKSKQVKNIHFLETKKFAIISP